VLVSYTSEPILAFGAMKLWKERGLCPLLKSIRTALIRGVVNEGTLGEISAMILLLNSMDELNVGLGWSTVHEFLKKLAMLDDEINLVNWFRKGASSISTTLFNGLPISILRIYFYS
jgi:hypothetical protein